MDQAIPTNPAADKLAGYMEHMEPELMNVTRLFGIPDEEWLREPRRFTWRMEEHDCRYNCLVRDAQTEEDAASQDAVPASAQDERLDDLHRKRAARRLCKHTMYLLCKKITGIQPPWGSLTGVRPTHLIYEGLADRKDADALQKAAQTMQRSFDVTAEKANLARDVVATQLRMLQPDDNAMDVYIGIPFCTTRCTYCSFSSGEIGRGKLVEPYLEALFKEMEAGAALLKESGKQLRAVYVGGGTPTSLNEDQFARLMQKMAALFPGAMEYTVEAGRPDTITPAKLQAIKAAGVGRISINPQTMNDETLRIIGRAHTAQQVWDAYAMAREAGIHHINMDVIAGLPGETVEDFARTMEAAKKLRPESLTVHTLAIKRSSRLHFENYRFPDGEEAAAMVHLGYDTARSLGLEPYYLYRQKNMAGNQENVGYALPGHSCQYNVDMMEENTHILALGAGGISKRIYPEEGHIGRAPNVSNIEQYIARVDEMIGRKRELFLQGW